MSYIQIFNNDNEIPEFFYVFVNMNDIVTKNNIEVANGYMSASFSELSIRRPGFLEKFLYGNIDYLPFNPNPNIDIGVISMFSKNITNSYRVEYDCELFRKANYPLLPSRLSAIYAFADYESCKRVSAKYRWDLETVKRFRVEDIPLTRIVKVNMEIVSLARYAHRISMINQETDDQIWRAYWSGNSEFSLELPAMDGRKVYPSGTIWEYLIEGSLCLDV